MRGLDRCLADAIRSESLDHGGSFLDNYVPSSSVSFVLCKNCTVRSMCFVGKSSFLKFRRRDRTKGAIFLSVSLSIKEEESEGYNGQNGCQSLQLKDSVLIQEAGGNKISVKENGSGAALYTTKHLWAGAFAAMVSRTCIAPLEWMKLEYIVRREQRNLLGLIQRIATTEGIRGFWKGNLVNILRTAPFKSINFYAYDTYRGHLLKLSGNEETTNFERFIAGALGGLVPSLVSMAPAGAVFYGVYDILKSAYLHTPEGKKWLEHVRQEGDELNAFDQLELGPLRTLLYGAIAGACSERRVIRLKLSAVATCVKIVEHGGVPALYAGLIPSLLQVLPSAAISYFVYEFMKVVMKVESTQ
ncbi:BnaC02g43440D [Brassica napus]|uniref:BnaC02g43440D protein n=1 Tax=Brassica napus TaxID=3708 RepID=A0A078HAZ3_BRANA|nr:BnaC02g43440D [Brassica napus]